MPKDLTIDVPVHLLPDPDIEYLVDLFLGPEPVTGPTPIKGTIKAVQRKKPGFADGGVLPGPVPPISVHARSTAADSAASLPATPYSNKSSASPTLPPENPAARKVTSAPPGDFFPSVHDLDAMREAMQLLLWRIDCAKRFGNLTEAANIRKTYDALFVTHTKALSLRVADRAAPVKYASPLHAAAGWIDQALHETAAVEMIVSNQLDSSTAEHINKLVQTARDCFKAATAALQTLTSRTTGWSSPHRHSDATGVTAAPDDTSTGSSPHSRDAA